MLDTQFKRDALADSFPMGCNDRGLHDRNVLSSKSIDRNPGRSVDPTYKLTEPLSRDKLLYLFSLTSTLTDIRIKYIIVEKKF